MRSPSTLRHARAQLGSLQDGWGARACAAGATVSVASFRKLGARAFRDGDRVNRTRRHRPPNQARRGALGRSKRVAIPPPPRHAWAKPGARAREPAAAPSPCGRGTRHGTALDAPTPVLVPKTRAAIGSASSRRVRRVSAQSCRALKTSPAARRPRARLVTETRRTRRLDARQCASTTCA